MVFTYNVATDRGKVRLLCTDTDVATPAAQIFQDDEIDTFLALMGNSILRSAALALETIASQEVLLMKRIRLLDLQTDGPAEAMALLEAAKLLKEQAAQEEEKEEGGTFDYAEMVVDVFTAREKRDKEALRNG